MIYNLQSYVLWSTTYKHHLLIRVIVPDRTCIGLATVIAFHLSSLCLRRVLFPDGCALGGLRSILAMILVETFRDNPPVGRQGRMQSQSQQRDQHAPAVDGDTPCRGR